MSVQTATAPSTTQSDADEPLFARTEVTQFEEDDREAGVAIGRMLSLLFIYTVIAMAVSAYATYAHWMGK